MNSFFYQYQSFRFRNIPCPPRFWNSPATKHLAFLVARFRIAHVVVATVYGRHGFSLYSLRTKVVLSLSLAILEASLVCKNGPRGYCQALTVVVVG